MLCLSLSDDMEQGKPNYDFKIMLSMNNDVILLSVCVVLVSQLFLTILLVYYRSTKGKVGDAAFDLSRTALSTLSVHFVNLNRLQRFRARRHISMF